MSQSPYTMHYFPPTRLLDSLLEKKVFPKYGGLAGKHVLDAASGEGYHSERFRNAGAEVFPIDLSPSPQKNASKADVTALPFPDESFDFVFSSQLLEHLSPEDFGKALSEYKRVLRPEGRIILTVPLKGPLGYWASDIGHSGPEKHRNTFRTGDDFDRLAGAYLEKDASFGYQGIAGTVLMASLMGAHRLVSGKNHSSQGEICSPPKIYKSAFERALPFLEKESIETRNPQAYCYIGRKL